MQAHAGLLYQDLVKRYGTLPAGVAGQIEQAPLEALETWIDRAMDAGGVDQLFGGLQAGQRQAPPAAIWAT